MTSELEARENVFILWHARHLIEQEDGRTLHRDSDGEVRLDETEWRNLGVYPTESAAEAQEKVSMLLPGFRDEPDCFVITPMEVDTDDWIDGFFTEHADGRQED
ncbi:hypothetical protein [Streptomyces sp. NPDC048411]|uniref:hypothetical protein n=1 Tax=unclassified Streptomyces TaxID=2593676 RepID=UPI0034573920